MKTDLKCGLALVPAEADDLRYVSECIRASVVASVRSNEASLSELWSDTTVAVALDNISERRMGDEVFVLKDGDARKGMLWMGISRDQYNAEPVGYLLGIYVDPSIRRKGIGTELMRGILKELKKHGFMRVSLAVQKANYALRLYEKAGFRIIGGNAEEYIMVCDLR